MVYAEEIGYEYEMQENTDVFWTTKGIPNIWRRNCRR